METKGAPTSTRREPTPRSTEGKADAKAGTISSGAPPGATLPRRESPITLRMRNAGRAWDEFNSLPSTPPPMSEPPSDAAVPNGNGPMRSGRRRSLVFLCTGIVLGLGAVLAAFALRTGNQDRLLPAPSEKAPPQAARAPEQAAPKSGSPADDVPTRRPPDVPPTGVALQASVRPPTGDNARVESKQGRPHGRLKKRELPTPLHRATSPQPSEVASEPKSDLRPISKPATDPVEEFGMDLARPSSKHRTKLMDEKDPYTP